MNHEIDIDEKGEAVAQQKVILIPRYLEIRNRIIARAEEIHRADKAYLN